MNDPKTFEQWMDRTHPDWRTKMEPGRGADQIGGLYDAWVAGARSTWDSGTLRQKYAAAAIQGILANPIRWQDIQRRYDKGQLSYDDASIKNAEKAFNIADHMVALEANQGRYGPTLFFQVVEMRKSLERVPALLKATAEAKDEAKKYAAALRWYADKHHLRVNDWEEGTHSPVGWLCPPTQLTLPLSGDDKIDYRGMQVQLEKFLPPWEVENGAVARAVLYDGAEPPVL